MKSVIEMAKDIKVQAQSHGGVETEKLDLSYAILEAVEVLKKMVAFNGEQYGFKKDCDCPFCEARTLLEKLEGKNEENDTAPMR